MGELDVDGHASAELGSRKARTLLSVLALARGHPVTSDELIEVLWGDDPPSRPVDQLGVLVSRLRRVVGADLLPRAGRGYALRQAWLDVDEAHARLADAEARRAAGSSSAARAGAEAVLELTSRGLLPGEEGEWVAAERVALERAAARARAIVVETALDAGDTAAAAAAAARALDEDPYDEAALRLLMRAHVASGRPGSALGAYAEARRRLIDDLGVAPTAETEAVHLAILLGEQGAPSRVPSSETLVGRSAERAALQQALDATIGGRARTVVIEGEAGMGKTALLQDLLSSARPRMAVIEGRCDVLGRDLPLQPVIEGLDLLLAGLGPDGAEAALAGDRSVVAPLLGRVDVVRATDRMQAPGEPSAARALLHAALARVVHRLAARYGGALIALDDVHLAGTSTIEWLQHIAGHGGRVLIVATRRPGGAPALDGWHVLRLGPLGVDDAISMCGDVRGEELHARSGGNPLFLKALAAAGAERVPADVRAVVAGHVEALGSAAPAVLAAAVLGPDIDIDLIADAAGTSARTVLDDLDAGLVAGLLAERSGGLSFAHELLREAMVEMVTAGRRAFLHREAGRSLARRPRRDALAVAWNARLGGDVSLAASELVVAARAAASRHDLAVAEQLVAESLELEPSADASLARVDFLVSRGAFAEADAEAARAIALGAGAAGHEASGWVAYYRRDRARALRVALDGARLEGDATSRGGCLALAGRILHSQGRLPDAERRLIQALHAVPAGRQSMARVWLGGLRVHQGRPQDALDLVDGALVDPGSIRHPFAEGHGHFARWYALAQLGRPADVLAEIDRFEATHEPGDPALERFRPVTRNLRSWVARSVGDVTGAEALSAEAVELTAFPNLAEPRVHAMLDLAELALVTGDVALAVRWLDEAARQPDDVGTMLWAREERGRLLRARVALALGDSDDATQQASAVAQSAAARGSRRHEVVALVLLALADPQRPSRIAATRTHALLAEMDRCAGMESWRWTAEAAAAWAIDPWWSEAEHRARQLAARAGERGADVQRLAAAHMARLQSN